MELLVFLFIFFLVTMMFITPSSSPGQGKLITCKLHKWEKRLTQEGKPYLHCPNCRITKV